VFTDAMGAPLVGTTVTNRFQRALGRAGLSKMRFHDLRHGTASLLLSQGVNPRVVMERLGHSTISLTLGTYSHVIPAQSRP
jgi:integrase